MTIIKKQGHLPSEWSEFLRKTRITWADQGSKRPLHKAKRVIRIQEVVQLPDEFDVRHARGLEDEPLASGKNARMVVEARQDLRDALLEVHRVAEVGLMLRGPSLPVGPFSSRDLEGAGEVRHIAQEVVGDAARVVGWHEDQLAQLA